MAIFGKKKAEESLREAEAAIRRAESKGIDRPSPIVNKGELK